MALCGPCWRLLDGRLPDPDEPDEAVLDFERAREFGLEGGDRLRLRLRFVLVDYEPGADPAATSAQLQRALQPYAVYTAERPNDLVSFGRTGNVPVALGALLLMAASATLAQTLVSGVRRRRRDLATVRSLGLLGRQVTAVIAWQATTFAVCAVLVGLPIGLVAGEVAWRVLADRIGVDADPVISVSTVVLTLPVVVLLANLVALAPAIRSRRLRVAEALRAE